MYEVAETESYTKAKTREKGAKSTKIVILKDFTPLRWWLIEQVYPQYLCYPPSNLLLTCKLTVAIVDKFVYYT